MEPRHAKSGGDLVDRRVESQVIVDDVTQGGAHARLGLADQRRHDRLLVVADVLQARGLGVGEHQHLEAAPTVMAIRLQGEIPVAGDVAGRGDAAVLQRRRTVRVIVPPERRQAVGRFREGIRIRLDHEYGLAVAHRQAVAAVSGSLDDGLAVGNLHPGQARIGRTAARLAVTLQIHLAADHGVRSPGRRGQQQAAQPGGRQFHGRHPAERDAVL